MKEANVTTFEGKFFVYDLN